METTNHSLAALIRELRDETTTLVRQEIALAKAEASEKAARLIRNAIFIAGGAALAYAALIVLLLGCRDLLSAAFIKAEMSPESAAWLASFIVAIIFGAISWALIAKGKKALADEGLAPKKTIQSLREDQHFIKEKLART